MDGPVWEGPVLGSRTRSLALDRLKLEFRVLPCPSESSDWEEEEFSDASGSGGLRQSTEEVGGSWRRHHGSVMRLVRPDSLGQLQLKLIQRKEDRMRSVGQTKARRTIVTIEPAEAKRRSTVCVSPSKRGGVWAKLQDLVESVEEEAEEKYGPTIHERQLERRLFCPTHEQWASVQDFFAKCVQKHGSVERTFALIDTNGNGSISATEFSERVVYWGFYEDSKESKKVFYVLDADMNGTISVREFCGNRLLKPREKPKKLLPKASVGQKVVVELDGDVADPETWNEFVGKKFPAASINDSFRKAFRAVDNNGNGFVSQSEFIAGLQSLKYPGNRQAWKKLFLRLDEDADGSVDVGEFSSWLVYPQAHETLISPLPDPKQRNRFIVTAKEYGPSPSAKFSCTNKTPKLGHFMDQMHTKRYTLGQAWILPGSQTGDGWVRDHGAVLKLQRLDRVRSVDEGLARLAAERREHATCAKRWYRKPLSVGRDRPPPVGLDRPRPTPCTFSAANHMMVPSLPLCSRLEHNAAEDPYLWRRTAYN